MGAAGWCFRSGWAGRRACRRRLVSGAWGLWGSREGRERGTWSARLRLGGFVFGFVVVVVIVVVAGIHGRAEAVEKGV